jgi:uncharacterized membrane protein YkvA (DUF1232 family)
MILERLKEKVRQLNLELFAIQLACRDPRMPWYAKVLAICVVGYALSPIDLIPDFIPIIGYLDDLIIVPLGMMLVLRMIPSVVMAECRVKAQSATLPSNSKNWIAAVIILIIWILIAVLSIRLLMPLLKK